MNTDTPSATNDRVSDMVAILAQNIIAILDNDISATLYKGLNKKTPNEPELKAFTKSLENAKDDIAKNQKPVDDNLNGNYLQ